MWSTDSKIEERRPGISLIDAMKHESERDGILTLESFEGYEDFDTVFVAACNHAAHKAFGHRFKGYEPYGKPKTFLRMGREKLTVVARCTLYIRYAGLLDFIADAGDFNRVFMAFRNAVAEYIQEFYPEVKVSMTHGGARKRTVAFSPTVTISSRLPMRKAA